MIDGLVHACVAVLEAFTRMGITVDAKHSLPEAQWKELMIANAIALAGDYQL